MEKMLSEKSMKKKEYIIQNAKNVFKRKGFVDVTMQDIVDECQISRGGLYKYFSTTTEIFEGVLQNTHKETDVLEEQMSRGLSFYDIMRKFFEEQIYELRNRNDSIRVATYEFFINQKNEKTKKMIQESFEQNIAMVEKLILYGIERNEIKKVGNINAMAFHIVAWLEGLNLISIVTEADEKKFLLQFETILSYFKER